MSHPDPLASPPAGTEVPVAAALLAAAATELAEHGPSGVSLRAVARRAGVSHAAPKHHFRDRAGMLTALAVDGFQRLTADLRQTQDAPVTDSSHRVAALGRAYLDFGLAHPALFELMFRPDQLHRDDPALHAALRESFDVLAGTLGDTGHPALPAGQASLISWALVHGLVALVRDGALVELTDTGTPAEAAELARTLTTTFTTVIYPEPS